MLLKPLGQKLVGQIIDYTKFHKALPSQPQDEQYATHTLSSFGKGAIDSRDQAKTNLLGWIKALVPDYNFTPII